MATKRLRSSGNWEYVVRRKGLLKKPVYLTFDTEEEGDREVTKLEAMLDKGIIPQQLQQPSKAISTVPEAIEEYQGIVAVGESDKPLLAALSRIHKGIALSTVNYEWVENWITSMKRERKIAPSTIRHHVGALSRCFNWSVKKDIMLQNPILLLEKGYASYTDKDAKVAGVRRVDQERDRRISTKEEESIRKAIKSSEWPTQLSLMFTLGIETAMRMRETYTLTADQIDLPKKTIFLDKTKNGDKRQVPLSSVAVKALQATTLKDGPVFPWWDGDLSQKKLRQITWALSRTWAAVFEAAKCEDLHYHDLRHETTSRIYERTKLTDLQIAKITGHKDLRQLKRYANLRGSDLAR